MIEFPRSMATFLGGRAPFFAAVICTLSSCGPQSQSTPEPFEIDKVDQLVEELGTQRTWNRETLLANPTPDGLLLKEWVDRRRATQEGTLSLSQLPALENPGSVKATLEWERKAQQAETGASVALTHYMLDIVGRQSRCKRTAAIEWKRFNETKAAHARGLRSQLVDWSAVNQQYDSLCNREVQAQRVREASDLQEEEMRRANQAAQEAAIGEQLRREEDACTARYEADNTAYINSATAENAETLSNATVFRNQCMERLISQRSASVR